MSEGKRKQYYPTKGQYACKVCKDRKFYSWADFENHHSQHAVQYAMTKLPTVKLVQLSSARQNKQKKVSTKCTPSVKPNSVRKKDAPQNSSCIPPNNELSNPVVARPGSCEELPDQSAAPSEEVVAEQADNILDPDFIEQLGLEISFLNQASGEAQPTATQDIANSVGKVLNEAFGGMSSLNKGTCSISPADSTVATINKEMAHVSTEIEIISEKPPLISEASDSGKQFTLWMSGKKINY